MTGEMALRPVWSSCCADMGVHILRCGGHATHDWTVRGRVSQRPHQLHTSSSTVKIYSAHVLAFLPANGDKTWTALCPVGTVAGRCTYRVGVLGLVACGRAFAVGWAKNPGRRKVGLRREGAGTL